MIRKKIISAILSLSLSLTLLSLQVFAMSNISVDISFVVENVSGTIIVEEVDNAPKPDNSIFTEVNNGKFTLTYSEPDTYYYKIYQEIKNDKNIIYDNTIYNLIITVIVNEDNNLETFVTIGIDGEAEKKASIIFTNKNKNCLDCPSDNCPDCDHDGPCDENCTHIKDNECPNSNCENCDKDKCECNKDNCNDGPCKHECCNPTNKAPDTGDNGLILWIGIMIISFIGIISVFSYKHYTNNKLHN